MAPSAEQGAAPSWLSRIAGEFWEVQAKPQPSPHPHPNQEILMELVGRRALNLPPSSPKVAPKIPVVALRRSPATHRFILFAEDGHGHGGEECQGLCLRGEELPGRKGPRTEGSEGTERGTHSRRHQLVCHLPMGESNPK